MCSRNNIHLSRFFSTRLSEQQDVPYIQNKLCVFVFERSHSIFLRIELWTSIKQTKTFAIISPVHDTSCIVYYLNKLMGARYARLNADFNDVVRCTHCARRKNAHHTMIRYLLCFVLINTIMRLTCGMVVWHTHKLYYLVIPRRRRRDIDLELSVRLFVRPGVTNLFGLYFKDY